LQPHQAISRKSQQTKDTKPTKSSIKEEDQLPGILAEPSTSLSPSTIQQLQKTIGNRAVTQLMKSRLQNVAVIQGAGIGTSDMDKNLQEVDEDEEVEKDKAAEKVDEEGELVEEVTVVPTRGAGGGTDKKKKGKGKEIVKNEPKRESPAKKGKKVKELSIKEKAALKREEMRSVRDAEKEKREEIDKLANARTKKDKEDQPKKSKPIMHTNKASDYDTVSFASLDQAVQESILAGHRGRGEAHHTDPETGKPGSGIKEHKPMGNASRIRLTSKAGDNHTVAGNNYSYQRVTGIPGAGAAAGAGEVEPQVEPVAEE
jgi:hypothetical protein